MDYVNTEKLLCGAGNDYSAGPYSVTISAGLIETSYDIHITNDDLLEENETFYLFINPSILPRDVIVGDINQAEITIINDDGKVISICITQYGSSN